VYEAKLARRSMLSKCGKTAAGPPNAVNADRRLAVDSSDLVPREGRKLASAIRAYADRRAHTLAAVKRDMVVRRGRSKLAVNADRRLAVDSKDLVARKGGRRPAAAIRAHADRRAHMLEEVAAVIAVNFSIA